MAQFVVLGLGHFGMHVARALAEQGKQVLAIDKNEKKVAIASEFVAKALQLDATDKEALESAKLENIDTAIVSTGSDVSASLMITLLLKEIGIPTVISKTVSELHGRILQKVGATKIVYPEKETAEKLAKSLIEQGILEYIALSPEHKIIEMEVPPNLIGKTIGELKIGTKYGVQIIAVKRQILQPEKAGKTVFDEDIIVAPSAQDGLLKGDRIVLLGSNKNMEKIKWLSPRHNGWSV